MILSWYSLVTKFDISSTTAIKLCSLQPVMNGYLLMRSTLVCHRLMALLTSYDPTEPESEMRDMSMHSISVINFTVFFALSRHWLKLMSSGRKGLHSRDPIISLIVWMQN